MGSNPPVDPELGGERRLSGRLESGTLALLAPGAAELATC